MTEDKIESGHEQSLEHPGHVRGPELPKEESAEFPTLYVFRHGQTVRNIERVFCGRFDSPLTEEGVKQAEELAEKMKDKQLDLGIYSNLSRAEATLDIVLKHHPNTPKESSDLILERDYGDLTGESKTALNKIDPELTRKYRRSWDFPPPNGESLKMVWEERLKAFCENLKLRMKEEQINVAVSCTNNTMRLIRMHFENLSIEQMLEIENPTAQDYAAYVIK